MTVAAPSKGPGILRNGGADKNVSIQQVGGPTEFTAINSVNESLQMTVFYNPSKKV